MNPLRALCVVAFLLAAVSASPNRDNSVSNKLKPSQWLNTNELEEIPSLDEITLEKLENMSAEKGAKLVQKVYHLSQINHELSPSFVPSPSNIPVYLVNSNGKKETCNLGNYVEMAKQQSNFGDEEVTIFITGLPQTLEPVKKANRKLIQAYVERYNQEAQQPKRHEGSSDESPRTSSEESSSEWKNKKATSGNLIVIDLGATITNFKRFAMLDTEQSGAMIGKSLVRLTNDCDVPQEIIHVVAQGLAAHVAGTAGDEYTRLTGHQLRRITALDPSKHIAKNPKVLSSLSRGDAEFVDAIHTSAYGMGTSRRVGDIDFFPNGPSAAIAGAKNVIEAHMRATRFYAESLRPGNERNFPAVEANSLKQYKNNNGFGKRAYMGINTEFDLEGDYMLQVNEKSPFGMRAPAQKQNSYHGVHESWKQDRD